MPHLRASALAAISTKVQGGSLSYILHTNRRDTIIRVYHIECGSTSCQIGEKPLEEKDDDVMPMAVPGEVASDKDAL